MSNIKSYYQLIDALELFASNHQMIKRFKSSFVDQVDNFVANVEQFPVLYVVPTSVSFDAYTDRLSFNIICVDILQKDRSNETDILNDTYQILRDLYKYLRFDYGFDVSMLNVGFLTPLNNYAVEYTVGWQMSLDIDMPASISTCNIPFEEDFSLTGVTCDNTYVQNFLRCSDLVNCPTIQELYGEIIIGGTFSGSTLTLTKDNGSEINISGFTGGGTGGNPYNDNTGIYNFSGVTLNGSSATTFNVTAVDGFIQDTRNPLSPTSITISYSGGSNLTTPFLNTHDATFLLIDENSQLVLQNTQPTNQERRENIYIAKLIHSNRIFIEFVSVQPDVILTPLSQLRDLVSPIKFINNNIYPTPNANLTINTSAGSLFGLGINWVNNTQNPNEKSFPANTPVTFRYATQAAIVGGNTTLIDPLNYDLNGVVTPIPGSTSRASNQRIYLYPSGQIRIQYGQIFYNTLSFAIQGLSTEPFITQQNIEDNAILIGIISVAKNTTDLTNTARAAFFNVSKFGELFGFGGGTTNLQQAYNNSPEPEIIINTTGGALSIQNGTGNANNVTNLFEGVDSSGNTTSFIRADGVISGTTFFGDGSQLTGIDSYQPGNELYLFYNY